MFIDSHYIISKFPSYFLLRDVTVVIYNWTFILKFATHCNTLRYKYANETSNIKSFKSSLEPTLSIYNYFYVIGFYHISSLFFFRNTLHAFSFNWGNNTLPPIDMNISKLSSIMYTYSLCRGHLWRVQLADKETLTIPGTWPQPLFPVIHKCPSCTLLFMLLLQCISSFAHYISMCRNKIL